MNFDRLAVKISGGNIEMLSFPLVHVHLDNMPVGAMKGCVNVEHALDVIITRGEIVQVFQRITIGVIGNRRDLTGSQTVDVSAKERSGREIVVEPQPWLRIFRGRDHHKDATVSGCLAHADGKSQLKLQRRVCWFLCECQGRGCQHQKKKEANEINTLGVAKVSGFEAQCDLMSPCL